MQPLTTLYHDAAQAERLRVDTARGARTRRRPCLPTVRCRNPFVRIARRLAELQPRTLARARR